MSLLDKLARYITEVVLEGDEKRRRRVEMLEPRIRQVLGKDVVIDHHPVHTNELRIEASSVSLDALDVLAAELGTRELYVVALTNDDDGAVLRIRVMLP